MLASAQQSFFGQGMGGMGMPFRGQQGLGDVVMGNWPFSPAPGSQVQANMWPEFPRTNMVPSSPEMVSNQASMLGYFNSQMQQLQRLQSLAGAHASATSGVHAPATPSTVPDHSSSTSDRSDDEPQKAAGSNKIFPRRKAGQTFRINNKPVVLNEKVLRQYFDLPLHEAAVQLGISATAMKSACRKCGIKKWPYRTVSSKGGAAAAASTTASSSSPSVRPRPVDCGAASPSLSMASTASRRTSSAGSSSPPPMWMGCGDAAAAASRLSPVPNSPTDVCQALASPPSHAAAKLAAAAAGIHGALGGFAAVAAAAAAAAASSSSRIAAAAAPRESLCVLSPLRQPSCAFPAAPERSSSAGSLSSILN